MTLTTREEETLRQALAVVAATTPIGRDYEELEQGRLDPEALLRRRRVPPAAMAAVAFAAMMVLIAPVALLLTGDGNGPVATTPASTDQTVTEATENGLPALALGEPLWQRAGDEVSLGDIVSTGTGFLVNGTENTHADPWPVFTLTSPDGVTWTQAWEQRGFDTLFRVASNDTVTLALGASSGDASTLYRWNPDAPSWDPIALPLPDGAAKVVAQHVAAVERGWLVVGIATPSSFDDQSDVIAWRSTNTIDWTIETIVEDLGAVYLPGAVVDSGQVETVVGFARIGEMEGENLPHPVIFDSDGQGAWRMSDLTRLVVDDGQVDPAMQNVQLIDAEIHDGSVTAWWHFDNAQGDDLKTQSVVTRRSSGSWSATNAGGPSPKQVIRFGGHLIAIRQPAGYYTEAPTVLLRSTDGLTWEETAIIDGIALRQLAVLDDGQLLASGESPDPDDSQATTGGIWILEPPPGD